MTKISDADLSELRQSGQFDADWYASHYADVLGSGMDPAEHFLRIGVKLGRIGKKQEKFGALNVKCTSTSLDVLFIDGTSGSDSGPGRMSQIADGLKNYDWDVRCVRGDELSELMREDLLARFVVFHRAPYWQPYVDFVDQMRGRGSIIVYDVDDIIFDESVIPLMYNYNNASEQHKDELLQRVQSNREFIINSDGCTTSTSFLCEEISKLGIRSFKVRNTMSNYNIQFFERLDFKRKGRPAHFVIGYYPESQTCEADFQCVAPALTQFMTENTNVIFRVVGELNLRSHPTLEYWRHVNEAGSLPRVTTINLMQHDVMIRDQISCDLIISPLEVGNPFCEAKSDLKFVESSIAKCPVIASPSRSFFEGTVGGQLAHLATTTEQWLRAFREIYHDYEVYLERALLAYHSVRQSYTQRSAAFEAKKAYEQFAVDKCGLPSKPLAIAIPLTVADIGVVIPDFSGPSGGHRKIFSICRAIIASGYTLKLYFYTSRSLEMVRDDIDRTFGPVDADLDAFSGIVQEHSVVICTQWKTAYDFRMVPFAGRVINFIQDFEPLFFPAGSDYIRARICYLAGFENICYGKWVAAKLKDELGIKATSIPFTIEHTVYAPPLLELDRDIDVLVFARATQDRRCFDLVQEGLIKLKSERPEICIVLFGEDEYGDLGFEFESLGTIVSLDELAKAYHRTKVGICFSTTNPSQLGYEMVACGACLVDVYVKFSELNFGGDRFVKYCDGSPDALSGACQDLLDNAGELDLRRGRGYAYVRKMPPEVELGNEFMRAADLISRSPLVPVASGLFGTKESV